MVSFCIAMRSNWGIEIGELVVGIHNIEKDVKNVNNSNS